jgi:hypothetical protein
MQCAHTQSIDRLLLLISTMRHLLHHDMWDTLSWHVWVPLTRTLTPSEMALHKLSR